MPVEERTFVNKLVKSWLVSAFSDPMYTRLAGATSTHTTISCVLFIQKTDMKSNNYNVVEAGETIIFRGLIERSLSQAYFLTFCTAIGMASLALVLQIQFQDFGTWP
jgi:hypothetical protein